MEVVLHERELDLMQVLWDRGSATAAEVRNAITDDLAYNTVLTILRRLEEKGYVRHEEQGRSHRYFPCVAPQQARDSALRRLTRGLFRGSPELLLTHLLSREKLSRTELERLRRIVEDQLRESGP